MRKLVGPVIILIVFALVIYFLLHEYRSVVSLSSANERGIVIADSLTLMPSVAAEGNAQLSVDLNFKNITDTVVLKELQVNINGDNAAQKISLATITGYSDTSSTEPYVKKASFFELPHDAKTFTPKKNHYKSIYLLFFTDNVEKSNQYRIHISGMILYKKNTVRFNKDLVAERTKVFRMRQLSR